MVTMSSVPGRLRLHCRDLAGRQGLCHRVHHHLERVGGVVDVEVNHRTGRLLVIYDVERARQDDLLAEIQSALATAKDAGAWLARPRQSSERAPDAAFGQFARAVAMVGLRNLLPAPWNALLPAAAQLVRRTQT